MNKCRSLQFHNLFKLRNIIKLRNLSGLNMTNERLTQSRSQAILYFWFGDPQNPKATGYGQEKSFWWTSTEKLDNEIREKFLGDYEKALRGEYQSWEADPYGTLALILLFDQIPRNIFRGKPETYATDHLALKLAKMALGKGYADHFKIKYEKKFAMMPLAHSENLEDQAKSVALTNAFGVPSWMSYTNHYYETIKKFGRFPHRNAVLGRKSTPEEMRWQQW